MEPKYWVLVGFMIGVLVTLIAQCLRVAFDEAFNWDGDRE